MSPSATPPGAVRILLIDDSDDMRTLMKYQLDRRADFVVVGEAADGIQAVAQAQELQPDLVLCDVALPYINGIEALPAILVAAPDSHVVMFSSRADELTERRALRAGAAAYLVRNGSRCELTEVIDNLFKHSR